MFTIREQLWSKSNYYRLLEKEFEKKTGKQMISRKKTKIKITKKASIIIPFFKTISQLKKLLLSLENQTFLINYPKKMEILIINDSPDIDITRLVKNSKLPIKLIYNKKNRGRPFTRNVGIANARNEILFFFDQDVILEPEYIEQHMIRHELFNNILLVSLKKDIKLADPKIGNNNISKGKIKINKNDWTDFRFKKDLYTFCRNLKPNKKIIKLLVKTDFFKKFGKGRFIDPCNYKKGENFFPNYKEISEKKDISILEYYRMKFENSRSLINLDLPLMVVSNNMSVSKKIVMKSGGFSELFRGWGCEDTHFGATAIAAGAFVIPCICVSAYVIKHKPRVGSVKEKYEQMIENWFRYQKLLEAPLSKIKIKSFRKSHLSQRIVENEVYKTL